jgi:predicted RNA binding protein YcfA (HicA-like mRNA interferase family)
LVSERLPRITADQAVRALKRAGWRELRQRGSHVQMDHPGRDGRVTVARHRGIILRPKTLKSILAQAGLTVDEFRELL